MAQTQPLDYSRLLTAPELANVREGHLPGDMDDKWFCVVEGNQLYLHRSWTGNEMFQAELRPNPNGGAELTNLVRNTNRTEFNMDDAAATDLFDRLLTRLATNTL